MASALMTRTNRIIARTMSLVDSTLLQTPQEVGMRDMSDLYFILKEEVLYVTSNHHKKGSYYGSSGKPC
jgi:hypothetical protein